MPSVFATVAVLALGGTVSRVRRTPPCSYHHARGFAQCLQRSIAGFVLPDAQGNWTASTSISAAPFRCDLNDASKGQVHP